MLGRPELASFPQTLRKWLYFSGHSFLMCNGLPRSLVPRAHMPVWLGASIMGRT